jgi:hypothetical protein
MSLRESRRAQDVRIAQTQLAVEINAFARQHRLTDIEVLQAVNAWQATALKFMLRRERHPEAPDTPADEDLDEEVRGG